MKRSSHGVQNTFSFAHNNRKKPAMDFLNDCVGPSISMLDSLDMKHLGDDIFLSVNHFLGQTRVHIRRYEHNDGGEFHPTKDGISLSPKVWHSLCDEMKYILNCKSSHKVFVIDRDLCISKQMKDNVPVYVFQRLFQRKNMNLEFVPENVVLRDLQLGKLLDFRASITDRVKYGLITYTLSYLLEKELENKKMELKPVNDKDALLELMDSLTKCLLAAITLKITELINCFGCHESYEGTFMHDCVTKSRSEKWSEYFEQALYLLNWNDVAKDIVQKNLNLDFNYVLRQEEFFDGVDVKKLFKSIETLYVGEEEIESYDVTFSCSYII